MTKFWLLGAMLLGACSANAETLVVVSSADSSTVLTRVASLVGGYSLYRFEDRRRGETCYIHVRGGVDCSWRAPR